MSDTGDVQKYLEARPELANQLIGEAQAGIADAKSRLWDLTGVPDIAAGANALARGDTLAGIGQAGAGALQLGSAILPAARLAAGMPLRAALGGALADEAGTLRVWHGTPHTFEPVEHNPFGEFRNEAIGSGEGAQTYGWGHYVAGTPAVAETYKRAGNIDNVSSEIRHILTSEFGNDLNIKSPDLRQSNRQDDPNFLRQLWQSLRSAQDTGNEQTPGQLLFSRFPEFRHLTTDDPSWETPYPQLDRIGEKIRAVQSGHLLEVHVLPDEHELLDWDKPLDQQSSGVQEKLKQLPWEAIDSAMENRDMNPMSEVMDSYTGRHLYQALKHYDVHEALPAEVPGSSWYTGSTTEAEHTSKYLHSIGIPGIKYLDANSRSTTAPATYSGEMTPQQQLGLDTLNASGQARRWEIDPQVLHQNLIDNFTNSAESLARGNKGILPDVGEKLAALKSLDPSKIIEPPRTRNYVIFDPSNLRIIGRNGQRLEPIDHDPFSETKP